MKMKFMVSLCLIGSAVIATAQTPPPQPTPPPKTVDTQCVQQNFVCCQVPAVNAASPKGQGWYPNFSTTPGQFDCPPVSNAADAKSLQPIISCQVTENKLKPAVFAMAPNGTWAKVNITDAIYPKNCGQASIVLTTPPIG